MAHLLGSLERLRYSLFGSGDLNIGRNECSYGTSPVAGHSMFLNVPNF